MPWIRAICVLPPESLPLPPRAYGDWKKAGVALILLVEDKSADGPLRIGAAVEFEVADDLTPIEREHRRLSEAERLLFQLNRLIRWCRTLGGLGALREFTLGQLGIVRFLVLGKGPPIDWGMIHVTPDAVSQERSLDAFVGTIQAKLKADEEPPVADLLLIDATQSVAEGRFREAVLLCWSVIDATFNQKFEELVQKGLADEWKESRDFLMGPDFGLRHKMGLGLRLVCGRSLFKEPDAFWTELGRSYKCRNKIIHEGSVATESDARLAIGVAQRLVRIMKLL